MAYEVDSTPTVFVDHEALRALLHRITRPGTRAALVGYGEYAKHLINIVPHHVVCIYDDRPKFTEAGMTFRGVPVLDPSIKADVDTVVCCEHWALYECFGRVVRTNDWCDYFYPNKLGYKNTQEIDVFSQSGVHRYALAHEEEAPISMMGKEKIRHLLEVLRYGQSISETANVLELGTWQGGSAYFIARALKHSSSQRKLYLADLFETHTMDPTATMCTDEIRINITEQYEHTKLLVGLVDDQKILDQIECPLCFTHIDLGYQERALEFVWENSLRGAPILLDNYGHLGAPPWRFDDFFAARGAVVIRSPWSEQGLVIKN